MKHNLFGFLCVGILLFLSVWTSAAQPVYHKNLTLTYVTVEGANCGSPSSLDGGDIAADLVKDSRGPISFVKKHIGPPVYEPLTFELDLVWGRAIYDWIHDSWETGYVRKNMSLISVDSHYMPTSQLQYVNAGMTEVTIPVSGDDPGDKSAAAGKGPVNMLATVNPEYITQGRPAGGPYLPQPQTFHRSADSVLQIDGLDCTKFWRIDPFTVKIQAPNTAKAPGRDAPVGSQVDFPNLRITIPADSAQTWQAWHDDFIVNGHNDDSKEKSGVLILKSSSGQELVRIDFHNLGILRLHEAPLEADGVRRLVAELYCEKMDFNASGHEGETKTRSNTNPPGAQNIKPTPKPNVPSAAHHGPAM